MMINNDRRAIGMRAIVLGLGLAALTTTTAGAADLVISNWDGYMAPDAMDAFKAATGIAGELVKHATNEEIMGKLVASGGKGYDVVFVSSPFAEVLNKLGLAEPIDHAKVPNLANLYPEAAALPTIRATSSPFRIPGARPGLCYRSDLVKTEPTSWNDLLKPADDAQGQDHHARDGPLAAGRRPAGQGLSVNETDPAKMER